jgi:hypothetical protein
MADVHFRPGLRGLCWLALFLVVATSTGCETLSGVTKEIVYGRDQVDESVAEEQHRKQYQTERSREALHWLLAHRVNQGMTHAEVARVLGEDGTYEENARWLKSNSTIYREDDELFRFGPDDRGQSIYLPFREGKLVHFDPKQFALEEDASPRQAGL